jgi:hypothetical protein
MLWKMKYLRAIGAASAILMAGSLAHAASISIVGSPLSIDAAHAAGSSFVYTGTLSSTDTISFSVSGVASLQSGPAYGTNAAGVVVTAGNVAGESVGSTANLAGQTTAFGALELKITGIGTSAIFSARADNGLGSSSPSQTLVFTGSLASVFGDFSPVANPTFTFVIADNTAEYFDNAGGYVVSTISPVTSSVPAPSAAWQSLIGIVGAGLIFGLKKSARATTGRPL